MPCLDTKKRQNTLQKLRNSKELFFDTCITQPKDKQTAMAKEKPQMPNL